MSLVVMVITRDTLALSLVPSALVIKSMCSLVITITTRDIFQCLEANRSAISHFIEYVVLERKMVNLYRQTRRGHTGIIYLVLVVPMFRREVHGPVDQIVNFLLPLPLFAFL